MPQMSPFNWFLMFLIFILAFITIMNKIFTYQTQFLANSDILNTNQKTYCLNKSWTW